MQAEYPWFLRSDSWQNTSEKAGDLNPSGKWFLQPGEPRLSVTCSPSCRQEHLQPHWRPRSLSGQSVLLFPNPAPVSWCKRWVECSGQCSLQRKNTPRVYRFLLSFQPQQQSDHTLLFIVRKWVQPRSSQFTKQEAAATAAGYSEIWRCQTLGQPGLSNHPQQWHHPEMGSLCFLSAKPEVPWGLGTILKHLWPQSPGQNWAHSRFSTDACWKLSQKWPVFLSYLFFFYFYGFSKMYFAFP